MSVLVGAARKFDVRRHRRELLACGHELLQDLCHDLQRVDAERFAHTERRLSRSADRPPEALIGLPAAFAEGHWVTGHLRVRHAESLLGVGRYDESRTFAEEGYGLLVSTFGEGSERAREAAAIIVRIYEAWHEQAPDVERAAAAERWRDAAAVDSE